MDKKKELKFNLNNFLLSVSLSLEAKSSELYNTAPLHNKRVAFIASYIAKDLGLEAKEISDIVSYSLIYNIGLIEDRNRTKEYFEFAHEFSLLLPFLNENKKELLYQKEYYNGSGMFGLKEKDITLSAQIISFSILLNEEFDLTNITLFQKDEINRFLLLNQNKLFSKKISDIFIYHSHKTAFWLDMQNEIEMLGFIFSNLEDYTSAITFEDLLSITSVLYYTINPNSQLLEICDLATNYYGFDHKDKYTFIIAASLYNLGKLFIPEKYLFKKEKLLIDEIDIIKQYPYYTKKSLSNIIGFNDIATWASNIQERIDSSGYPFGLDGKSLSLKDRLIAVLVAFDSMQTSKVYRDAYSKDECLGILKAAVDKKLYDKSIVSDLNKYLV